MPIKLVPLDWSRPALAQAVGWLVDTFAAPGELDLEKVIVTVPGTLVGRRLLELLVAEAERRGLLVAPPRIMTAGDLPEKLYEKKKPFASTLAQELAWVQSLQATDPERLTALMRTPPAEDDLTGWLALGQMLAQLHRELAAEGLNCGDVVQHAQHLDGFNELRRWELLADLQQRYLRLLDDLQLWDKQTARLFAIERRECRTDKQIVLVGMVDLNRSQRQMLDQVADRVTALIFGPSNSQGLFDEHGCLEAEAWQKISPNMSLDQIEITGGPGDQADAVVRAMAAWKGRYAAEEITIGVPDSRLLPYLRQRLEEAGLAVRYGAGTPLPRTGVAQLLAEVADYLEGRKFRDLAALVRHPAIAGWLLAKQQIAEDWISKFDRFFGDHLPDLVGAPGLDSKNGTSLVRRVQGAIAALVSPLGGSPRPLNEWSQPILNLLLDIYGHETLDEQIEPGRTLVLACDKIAKALDEHAELSPRLVPRVSGAQALRLLLESVAGEAIPPHADHTAIELLGWLDLPWDDAPALIVTGFNDGVVPGASGGDAFLPDALRRQMKLERNSLRRYARDCYTLCLLKASRPGLRVIAGRRSAEGDALIPSRLLLACDERELPARTRALLAAPPTAERVLLVGSLRPGQTGPSLLPRPLAEPLAGPVESLRVTEFRDFLACPYRYYLRHRLKLETLDDSAPELDGGSFGTVLHCVLREFGMGPARDADQAEAIRRDLFLSLGKAAAERFGEQPLPAVRLQIEMLRMRLERFAEIQAARRRDGWKILQVEFDLSKKVFFEVDGQPIDLHGRIDRIDVHEPTGKLAVLDYKSSDNPALPDKVHREGPKGAQQWIDLQLPLYQHMVRAHGVGDPAAPIETGYILLPKDINKINFEMAAWSDEELAAAIETAREVVRGIRLQKFEPPVMPPPKTFPEFAAICQEGRLAAALLDAMEEVES